LYKEKNVEESRCLPPTVTTCARKRSLCVKRGEKKIAVCRMLNISRSSLHSWLEREEQTGDCGPITHYQKGNRHKITDWHPFREFVQKHGDKTQAQMASLWGDNVTQQNISDALQKIGVSRKKRLTATGSEMN